MILMLSIIEKTQKNVSIMLAVYFNCCGYFKILDYKVCLSKNILWY